MSRYDAIVVGAGPAGATAAMKLSQKGMKILLIDRKRVPGTPKECAEGLGKGAIRNLNMKMDKSWISNEYDSVRVGILDSGNVLFRTSRTKGYVLNRKIFDRDLAMNAQREGANTLFGTAVRNVSIGSEAVVTTTNGEFHADLVIAADGPQSKIAGQAGLGKLHNSFAFQYVLDGAHQMPNTLQILVCPRFGFDVHCWIFPKKDSINIGVSSVNLAGLRRKLDELVGLVGLSDRKILEVNAGLLPGRNKLKRIYSDRLLVLGDAAGHTNPFSGGGIAMAIHDGALAAGVAALAIKSGRADAKFLSLYQRQWDASRFSRAWRVGYQAMGQLDRYLASGEMGDIFAKVGSEVIDSRKGVIRKFLKKGFTLREAIILYRMIIVKFGKMIDYV